jgi:hypothetical protein
MAERANRAVVPTYRTLNISVKTSVVMKINRPVAKLVLYVRTLAAMLAGPARFFIANPA